jgi:hypothetical protein
LVLRVLAPHLGAALASFRADCQQGVLFGCMG